MLRNVRHRPAWGLLAGAGALTLLTACGEPPEPPLTAPPGPVQSASGAPGGISGAPVPVPLPTGGALTPTVPTVPLPTYTPPTTPYTPPPTGTTPTTRPTSTVSPAPKCTNGPTKTQVLAVLEGLPGIPDEPLTVTQGPYCSGKWQFAAVRIKDDAKEEQLFVVTTGQPTTLKVIEAGTDVCSVEVQNQAPAGIKVRACG